MKKSISSFSFLVLLFISATLFAQNEVVATINVNPPYSPYLSSYVDQPNKVLLTLTNTTGSVQNLRLWVKISGDNGVSLTTAASFNPSQAISLGAYQTKMLSLNSYETRDYFDAGNVDLVGLTKAQLIQNQTLPEGNYQICVRALNYSVPQTPKSMDACAMFPIYYIDPPMAIQPTCGENATVSSPQFVLFNWTPPATAPGNIQYEFTLKEVPNTLNPNDVIKNTVFPTIFNTTQTGNTTLAYTVAFPQLENGKKYVWRVKAVDPGNSVQFKNFGFSEACWFTYKSSTVISDFTPVKAIQDITVPTKIAPLQTSSFIPYVFFETENQGTLFFPNFLSITTVTGRAVYHYPEETKTYPLKYATIRLLANYELKDENGNDLMMYNYNNPPDGIEDGSEMSIATTDADGNFTFTFAQNQFLGKVANNFKTGNGEFKSEGGLYRYAKVVLDAPHADFYVPKFSEKLVFNNGDTYNTGTLSTTVLAKDLEVTIKRYSFGISELENTSENLASANVYLCRKPIGEWDKIVYPQEDGSPDNVIVTKPSALNELEIVAKGEANSDGKVLFKKMVDNPTSAYTYYLYCDFPKDADEFSNYTFISGPVPVKKTCQGGFGCSKYFQKLTMEANYPRISGWLEDDVDGKRIPGIVFMKSFYVGTNNKNMIPVNKLTSEEKEFRDKIINDKCGLCFASSNRMFFAAQDGRFEFNNQPILFNTGTVKATGPSRTMEAFSVGYDEQKNIAVKSPLLLGQQTLVKISMLRGASISGTVLDGETGKGLSASFYFIDENGHSGYTYSDEDASFSNVSTFASGFDNNGNWLGTSFVTGGGKFANYPAKKLASKQKIVFKAEGYISDTLEVLVDKKQVDIGTIKLNTLKRRLVVIILDAKTKKLIKDAVVTLPEVKKPCTITIANNAGNSALNPVTNFLGECPLTEKAPSGITPKFSFKNAGGSENNSQLYTVHVSPPEGTEYLPLDIKTNIPYSSSAKLVIAYLEPGTCVSGYVYAGATTNSPVQGATVKMDITYPFSFWGTELQIKTDVASAKTDVNGKFTLHRVPLRNYPVIMRAIKSQTQFVGDSFSIITDPKGLLVEQMGTINIKNYGEVLNGKNTLNYTSNTTSIPSDGCKQHNFHLSVYNDMDITSLMGFPISVTELTPNGTSSATISGYFEGMPSNTQFVAKGGQTLEFSNIIIIPGTLKNANGVPVSQPQITPVTTKSNSYALSAYNVNALVEDKNLGIYLDKTIGGSQYGVLKGKVYLKATEFSQSVVGLTNNAYLSLLTGTDKMLIPVFNADKTVTKPADVPTGFGICDKEGNALKFSLPGFANHAKADIASSKFLATGELQLATRIETNIPNLIPSNLNIDAGIIKLKKGVTPTINSAQNIALKMSDTWTINSTDWKLDENGLVINNGKLNTGVEFSIKNVGIQYNKLNTNTTKVDISSIKLAQVHPINITSTQQTFGEIFFAGNTKVWQIYVGPDGTNTCGNISNLPSTGIGDKVLLHSINLYSNGQKNVFMKKSNLTLRNILPYHTNDMASILVNTESFVIGGNFDLNIPEKHTYSASLGYDKGAGVLKDLAFINAAPIVFNHPTALGHSFTSNLTLSPGKFTANGFSEEPGAFPKTKTTFYYTADSVSVWIDGGQDIPINGERKLGKAVGGMRIQGGAWSKFWFNGEMQGMPGISEVLVNNKPQRMTFTVEGGVSADGESITMSDVSTPFGNMTWSYNFPQSQLVGHCDIDLNLGSLGIVGGINSVVDGKGWYFQAAGQVTIPGLGAADLMGVFGDYSGYPQFLSTSIGDIKCMPPAFTNKVNGFMFQAGIHKQVVPSISFEIPAVLTVDFGVDLGLTTRVWRSFGPSSQYGISLLALGIAHANGSLDLTCSSIGAQVNAQVGISGTYNPGDGSYAVNGCASVGFGMNISQCLPPVFGLCAAVCFDKDFGHKDLGINVTYSKASGADMGIAFQSCNTQCK